VIFFTVAGHRLAQAFTLPSASKLLLFLAVAAAVTGIVLATRVAASVQAFGGGAGIAEVGAVYLGAAVIGAASPAPGGLGAIEAAPVPRPDRHRPARWPRGLGGPYLPAGDLLAARRARMGRLAPAPAARLRMSGQARPGHTAGLLDRDQAAGETDDVRSVLAEAADPVEVPVPGPAQAQDLDPRAAGRLAADPADAQAHIPPGERRGRAINMLPGDDLAPQPQLRPAPLARALVLAEGDQPGQPDSGLTRQYGVAPEAGGAGRKRPAGPPLSCPAGTIIDRHGQTRARIACESRVSDARARACACACTRRWPDGLVGTIRVPRPVRQRYRGRDRSRRRALPALTRTCRRIYSDQMDAAQRTLNDQIDDATQRLLGTARVIAESDLRQPSLLPGWTRAHVLAHLARSADAMRNLLIGARTGQHRPAYVGAQAREADIDAGARQRGKDLMADVADSAMAFRTIACQLPEDAWPFPVRILDSAQFPAAQLLTRRLVEVELHHCDLDSGYSPGRWPAAFAVMDLPEPMRSLRRDRLTRSRQP
jgi:maleylpyruvate isomerase